MNEFTVSCKLCLRGMGRRRAKDIDRQTVTMCNKFDRTFNSTNRKPQRNQRPNMEIIDFHLSFFDILWIFKWQNIHAEHPRTSWASSTPKFKFKFHYNSIFLVGHVYRPIHRIKLCECQHAILRRRRKIIRRNSLENVQNCFALKWEMENEKWEMD